MIADFKREFQGYVEHDIFRGIEDCEEFDAPQSGKTVRPLQCCSAFEVRRSHLPPIQDCFYCRYAEFDLCAPEAPETGVCRYPHIQLD